MQKQLQKKHHHTFEQKELMEDYMAVPGLIGKKTDKEKFEAALDEIEELHEKGQPVLVGTVSIDVSEGLSKKLKKRGSV